MTNWRNKAIVFFFLIFTPMLRANDQGCFEVFFQDSKFKNAHAPIVNFYAKHTSPFRRVYAGGESSAFIRSVLELGYEDALKSYEVASGKENFSFVRMEDAGRILTLVLVQSSSFEDNSPFVINRNSEVRRRQHQSFRWKASTFRNLPPIFDGIVHMGLGTFIVGGISNRPDLSALGIVVFGGFSILKHASELIPMTAFEWQKVMSSIVSESRAFASGLPLTIVVMHDQIGEDMTARIMNIFPEAEIFEEPSSLFDDVDTVVDRVYRYDYQLLTNLVKRHLEYRARGSQGSPPPPKIP